MRREPGKNTYIKVLDHMPDHPKIDGLSDRAFRVLVEAWCWCSRNLSDGHIPIKTWKKRSTPKATKELVTEGLIHVYDDHVEMHDYLDVQTSKAQVEHIREVRQASGGKGGRPKPNPNQDGTNLVSNDEANQNPEDRNQKTEENSPSGSSRRAHAGAHARPTPTDWNERSYSAQAHELVKHYRRLHNGSRIPSNTIGKLGQNIDKLLTEKFPPHHIQLGIARLHRRNLGVTMLADMVHDVTRDPEQIQYLDEHGIPLIAVDDIPDDAIRPNDVLGEDNWTHPPEPREILEGPHEKRLEYLRPIYDQHHADRRTEARRILKLRAEKTHVA